MSRAAVRKKLSSQIPWFKWLLVSALTSLAIFAIVFFFILPPLVAGWLNPTVHRPPYQTSAKAGSLHSRFFVADLHCDALLWNRNLLEKSATDHVDLPRLREGNVARLLMENLPD